MASATSPTVPLPTQPGLDDDDDDDEDVLIPVPPPSQVSATSIPEQTQPTSAAVATTTAPSGASTNSAIATPSGSATLGGSLPSGVQDPAGSGNTPGNNDQGLSSGATAGIAVGVVIAVLLMLVGGWFFIRRRRSRVQKTRTAVGDSLSQKHPSDEESAKRSEVYAYQAPAAVELGGVQDTGNGDRRHTELASTTAPVEITGDRQFAVELPGSDVPMRTGGK